jgi:hypothetical protein
VRQLTPPTGEELVDRAGRRWHPQAEVTAVCVSVERIDRRLDRRPEPLEDLVRVALLQESKKWSIRFSFDRTVGAWRLPTPAK